MASGLAYGHGTHHIALHSPQVRVCALIHAYYHFCGLLAYTPLLQQSSVFMEPEPGSLVSDQNRLATLDGFPQQFIFQDRYRENEVLLSVHTACGVGGRPEEISTSFQSCLTALQ